MTQPQKKARQEMKSHSTGPRTEAGKAISSQNALKHGLASGTLIIEGESREEYDALLNGFMFDHQPANQTETALVHEFTKALWLKNRALRFQAIAFNITMPHLDNMAAPMDLPVLLRYQMANERTFYRVLKMLQEIAKERRSAPKQFVSQQRPADPDALIVALATDLEKLQSEWRGFLKNHPNHPGYRTLRSGMGEIKFEAAR